MWFSGTFDRYKAKWPKYPVHANVKFLTEYCDANLLCFSETWLDNTIDSRHLCVDGFGAPVRADRTEASGMQKGGRLCFFTWLNGLYAFRTLNLYPFAVGLSTCHVSLAQYLLCCVCTSQRKLHLSFTKISRSQVWRGSMTQHGAEVFPWPRSHDTPTAVYLPSRIGRELPSIGPYKDWLTTWTLEPYPQSSCWNSLRQLYSYRSQWQLVGTMALPWIMPSPTTSYCINKTNLYEESLSPCTTRGTGAPSYCSIWVFVTIRRARNNVTVAGQGVQSSMRLCPIQGLGTFYRR